MKHNQISFDMAVKWIRAWRMRTDISGNDFIASKIPMEDANMVKDDVSANSIRAYNGYDEETQKYKLIIVGVDSLGNDIIDQNDPLNSKIYDLTLPCPDTCNVISPLFKETKAL